MNDSLRVEECQRFETLFANGGDLFLVHTRMGNYVGESASFEELHHNPELIFNQKRVVHLDDIRMMIVTHNHYFIEQ